MIPERDSVMAEIKHLQEQKKIREAELSKFLEQVRVVRKEVEDIDARLRSQWAIYGKFYREEGKRP